jgi:TolA-binding protein
MYLDVDLTTAFTLVLTTVILSTVAILFIFRLRFKRRRMPIVRSVFEERLEKTPTSSTSLTRTYTSDTYRIEQIIDKIHEIERKIEIVKMQNISEEAKNITIRELEEEKRILEEEIRKLRQ